MKIQLYANLFSGFEKDWDKIVNDYLELKKIIKELPKNFANIQILKRAIYYQGGGRFIKVKDFKSRDDYDTVQEFYKNHTFIYSFFIFNRGLEKNLFGTKKFFDFISKFNQNDIETIFDTIRKNLENIEKQYNYTKIVDNIVNRIISILKYSNNQKYSELTFRIKFNEILKFPKTILNEKNTKVLYLLLGRKFNILSSEKKKILETEKVKKIINANDFLTEYLDYFINYKDGEVDLITKGVGLNFLTFFLKNIVNDFIWLYVQEVEYFKMLKVLDEEKYYDFSFKIVNETYRGNASWEQEQLVFTIRKVGKPLDLEEKFFLYIPKVLKDNILSLFKKKDGLIVVSGATGSGKTTFLISILDYFNNLNKKDNKLVYTVEDPVEYYFTPKYYEFIQKEIGKDINSFADGIKVALRVNPNIIFIGETRDFNTAKQLLNGAESGHLTITTMHLNNPWDILSRLINLTDTEKGLIQDQLSKNLLATITMGLVPAKIPDLATGEKVDSLLPYFSILKPDNQIKVLLAEGDSNNIIALFTEFEKIKNGTVWPKELTLLHYYKLGLISKEQMEIRSDSMILSQVEVLYDRIFTKSLNNEI